MNFVTSVTIGSRVLKCKCDLCHMNINHSGKVHSIIDNILPLNVHIALQTELIFRYRKKLIFCYYIYLYKFSFIIKYTKYANNVVLFRLNTNDTDAS